MIVVSGSRAVRHADPGITPVLIGQQLKQIQELATVEYAYTATGRFENQRDFYGWPVPLTRKSFVVSFSGVIKAGVDLDSLTVRISGNTITVSLPPARFLSHEITADSIQILDEKNNVFNPLKIIDYTSFARDQKQNAEQQAREDGLLDRAAERARLSIQELLSQTQGLERFTLTIQETD